MQVRRIELSGRLQFWPPQNSNVVISVADQLFTAESFHRAVNVHRAEPERIGDFRLRHRKFQDAVASQSDCFHSRVLFTD